MLPHEPAVRRLLVPLDGSPVAEWALPTALTLAERLDCELYLVSVFDADPTLGGWPVSADGVREWFEAYLDAVAGQLRPVAGARAIVTQVLSGHHVARCLEQHAVDLHIDLVVMATHGRGALARAWLGSVADHMVRHAAAPVLLVRPGTAEPPALDAPVPIQRLLVPLDGSELAERALPWATRVAGPCDAALTVLRAVPPSLHASSPYLPDTIRDTREALAEAREQAGAYLDQVAGNLRRAGVTVVTELEVGVRPETAIIHYAERNPVDLVVLATHGRGGLARALLGSVADKVVRAGPVPVLLVRASN